MPTLQYSEEGRTLTLTFRCGLPIPGELERFTHEPVNSTSQDMGVLIPSVLKGHCSKANPVKKEGHVSNDLGGGHGRVGLFRPLLDYSRKLVSPKRTNSNGHGCPSQKHPHRGHVTTHQSSQSRQLAPQVQGGDHPHPSSTLQCRQSHVHTVCT